eukprot:2400982-Amphidinium_carterae.1
MSSSCALDHQQMTIDTSQETERPNESCSWVCPFLAGHSPSELWLGALLHRLSGSPPCHLEETASDRDRCTCCTI